HADLWPAEPAEEDVGERSPLLFVPGSVDVENDRPRRPGLIVVVPHHEHEREAADIDVCDAAVLHEPGKRTEADAVRGAPTRDAVDHAARTDRIAVAVFRVPRSRAR